MDKIFAGLCFGLMLLWPPLALAADKYAPPATTPSFNQAISAFTCYLGATVGSEAATVSAGGLDLGDNGFNGGAFAGCQNKTGRIVYGIEGDVTFSNLSPDLANVVIAESEYLASVRARLGYIIGNALLYATAGVAFSDLDITALGTKTGQSQTGFVYGGGIELDVTEHLFIRLEGLRYDFSGEVFASLAGAKADDQRDVFRLGAGWRF